MSTKNSRRDFLKKSVAFTLGTIAVNSGIQNVVAATAQHADENNIPEGGVFSLPPLPYEYNALEPIIDSLTMQIHHTKHHQGYVNNLNKALETVDSNLLQYTKSLEAMLTHIAQFPVPVRNNAGGHYNHSLFWTLMNKPKGTTEPTGKLAEAIKTGFGSFEEFKKQFTDAASKRFGSGWAWLIVSEGKLKVTSTPNQDNPLMNLDSIEIKGTPILALDVWEHAYYLKYQNRRADYIETWWSIVNWDTATALFDKAMK
jgi:Fe-Mn family superoxide dismutase